MPTPGPAEIVGRSRRVAAVIVVLAIATLLVTLFRARTENANLHRELRAAQADRDGARSERAEINSKLDETLRELRRAREDNNRLQRQVVELALAESEEEKEEIVRRYLAEQRRVQRERAAEDARPNVERPDDLPPMRGGRLTPSPPSPSSAPAGAGSGSPSPTQSPTCVPSPVEWLPPVCA